MEVLADYDPAAFCNSDCYVCKKNDSEDKLLICESCFTEVCHIYCLNPPLEKVPDLNWYCDFCIKNRDLPTKLPIAGIFDKSYKKEESN